MLKLGALLEKWRAEPNGCMIVLATGCFDLLHTGHVDLLTRAAVGAEAHAAWYAAATGIPTPRVRLLVGLNSDQSVAALKGPERPIVPFAGRLRHLLALRAVDGATEMPGPTPEEMIRGVRPDFYVKGGDYEAEELPEADACREVGARIMIVPRTLDVSTTGYVPHLSRVLPSPIALQDAMHGEVVGTVLWGNRLSLAYKDDRVVELVVTHFRVIAGEDDGTD